jgi:membrane protein required for colicin V production
MNGADYLILGVLAVSLLLGMYRGFVRESIGLLAWLGGLWLAWRYASLVEPFLGGALSPGPRARSSLRL